ncbi:Siderophore iron transporter [Alternaria alternata]|nr:Siderophore iron transporter [Alternaria alternata]
MDSIATVQSGTEPTREKSIGNMSVDEEDAIRKVEEANMPSHSAQEGVREVEAVTLAWTKTSLACAFIWYVAQNLSYILIQELTQLTACGSCTSQMLFNHPLPAT